MDDHDTACRLCGSPCLFPDEGRCDACAREREEMAADDLDEWADAAPGSAEPRAVRLGRAMYLGDS